MPEPLIVVALEEEAAHLDIDLPILITGVGKVNAALALTRWLATASSPPSMIINVGTAGALRSGLSGTHEIGSVLQHDFDSVSIEALTGKRFGAPIELAGEGLVLATGDVFVSNPGVRDRLAQHADLVDMEGYAVVAAAAAFDTPVRMVKHVSDEADHVAIKSWTSTVAESSRALASWLATS
jgi:adenosylhomocysteine nucleosidase